MEFPQEIISEIKNEYGLDIQQTLRLNLQDDRPLWKIYTDKGYFVLRLFNESHPLEEARKDLYILSYLERYNYPAPKLLKTLRGTDCFSWKNYTVGISSFVEGIPGNKKKDKETFEILGSVMAKLHMLEYKEYQYKSKWEPRVTIPGQLSESKEAINTDKGKLWQDVLEEIKDGLENIPSLSFLPQSIIHTDTWDGNLILIKQNEGILIDWYNSGTGTSIVDVGYSIAQACLWPNNELTEDIIVFEDLIKSLFKGYMQVRQLSKEEIANLIWACKFANTGYTASEMLVKLRNGEDKDKVLKTSANWKRFKFLKNHEDFLSKLF